ncbi:hypothetical protein E1176_03035 [Fulvivirga sp. RKSG066]|uniref:hypothetical protein n=1 Tax=Fulvivirga aurantia TaxID=2529383 RepID=UPI0012BC5A65|nr:hypothetical protein [Fulvivirga aurantia]MTI19987.1 hypothetical protein [Fulvivirga aurantia]
MSRIANEIIEEASQWMAKKGVEGVSEGEHGGKPCIMVLASESPNKLELPKTFKGYPVVIKSVGEIEAH